VRCWPPGWPTPPATVGWWSRTTAGCTFVEESDVTPGEAEIDLVNTGVWCLRRRAAGPAPRRVKKSSRTGEYYLTDVFETLERRGLLACEKEEAMGVNDRWQLAAAEAVLRRRKNRELAQSGVTIVDPDTTYIDFGVSIEADAVIHPFSFLRGRTSIGSTHPNRPLRRDQRLRDRP